MTTPSSAQGSPTTIARQSGFFARLPGLRERPHLLWVGLFAVLAVGLRLAWIAYVNPDPNDGRVDDTLFYDQAARALLDGRGYISYLGLPTAQWPPGYPFVLSAIYWLFGHNILLPKILNALAGGGTVILIYLIGSRVFNWKVGVVGGFLFAVFPGQVFYSTLIMTESTFPFLLTLLILFLLSFVSKPESLSPIRLLLLGVFFGALTLIRSEGFVLFAAAVLFWRIVVPSWRRFFLQTSLVAVGMFFAMVPWTIRNYIAMDAFIPFVTGGGHTLLAGHQDDPYLATSVFPEGRIQEKYSYLPYPEREIKVEQEATKEALKWAVHHPVEEMYYPFLKLYHLYKDDSGALRWINGNLPSRTGWNKPISDSEFYGWSLLADSYYIVLMVVAVAGIPFWFSLKDKKRFLLITFVGAWILMHMAFVPEPRYHAPLMPMFSLWAALTVVIAFEALRAPSAAHRERPSRRRSRFRRRV